MADRNHKNHPSLLLAIPQSVTQGSKFYVGDMEDLTFDQQLTLANLTVNVELSDDGTIWMVAYQIAVAGLTTTGIPFQIDSSAQVAGGAGTFAMLRARRAKFIRLNTTVYASGSGNILCTGRRVA